MAICKNPKKMYHQLLASLSASLSFMLIGMVRGYSSPAIPSMKSTGDHHLDLNDVSLMASLPPCGALIAALLSGPCLNSLGRRKTLLLTTVPWTVSFLMVSFSAGNKSILFAGRVIMGLMVGLSAPSAQIYIAECSSPRVRGTLGSLTALFLAIGILLTYIIGAVVEWDTLAWISSTFPVLLLISMTMMPESPTWLMSKNREEEARRSLQRLRGNHTDIDAELERIRNNLTSKRTPSLTFGELVQPAAIKPLVISLTLMVFQQFSGINVVIFFTVSIFKAAGTSVDDYISTIIIGAVQLVSTIPAMFLVDRLGRRILLIVSGLFMGLAMISMGSYFYIQHFQPDVTGLGWLPLTSMVVFVIAYSSGYGNVPYLIMSELFPSKYRNLFGSLAAWANLSCTFVVLFTFPRFAESVGNYGAFWFYAACSLSGVFVVYFLLPETKGKTLEEIEQLFAGKTSEFNDVKYSPAQTGDKFEAETRNIESNMTMPL